MDQEHPVLEGEQTQDTKIPVPMLSLNLSVLSKKFRAAKIKKQTKQKSHLCTRKCTTVAKMLAVSELSLSSSLVQWAVRRHSLEEIPDISQYSVPPHGPHSCCHTGPSGTSHSHKH